MSRTRDGKVLVQEREIMALEVFPAPADLNDAEQAAWNDSLMDIPAKFMRTRHLPFLRQYVRLLALVDTFDPVEDPKSYFRTLRTIANLQRHLGFSVSQEVIRQRNDADAKAKRELREKMLAIKMANAGGSSDAPVTPRQTSRSSFTFSNRPNQ